MSGKSWKTIAETWLKEGSSSSRVKVRYSESPSKEKVLAFFKNKPNGRNESLAFGADKATNYKLFEFLGEKVLKSFTLQLPKSFGWECLYRDKTKLETMLKRQGLCQYLSSILEDRNIREPVLSVESYVNREIDEKSVIEVFKEIHEKLGFEKILRIEDSFPDATCLKNGKEVQIEFESRSINFKYHGHDPEQCDYIVCWFSDWKDCPISVISLWEKLMKMTNVKINIGEETVLETGGKS